MRERICHAISRHRAKAPPPSFGEAIVSFTLALRAERRSPRTIDGYRTAAGLFAAFCATALDGPSSPLAVTPARVRAWLATLEETGRASPANTRYWQLRASVRFLREEGIVEDDPVRRVHPPTVPEDDPQVPSPDDIRRLLRTCSSNSARDVRDRALLLLAADSGARAGELASMRLAWLDLANGQARVTAKGGHERLIVFGRSTARALDRYLRARSQHPAVETAWLWLGLPGRDPRDASVPIAGAGAPGGTGWRSQGTPATCPPARRWGRRWPRGDSRGGRGQCGGAAGVVLLDTFAGGM